MKTIMHSIYTIRHLETGLKVNFDREDTNKLKSFALFLILMIATLLLSRLGR